MPLLADVYLSTARAVYNPTTTATSAPQAWLAGVQASLEPEDATQPLVFPLDAMNQQYRCTVDAGTDIVLGDVITSITTIQSNGTVHYPFAVPSPNGTWVVRYAIEGAPDILSERLLVIEYIITGGKAQ
jgi:hypothetical protein